MKKTSKWFILVIIFFWTLSVVPASALGPDVTPPTSPSGIGGYPVSAGQINIHWNTSTDPVVQGDLTTGVVGYEVFACGPLHIFFHSCLLDYYYSVAQTSSTNFSVFGLGLGPDTQIRLRVKALDAAGNFSDFSDELGINIPPVPEITFHAIPSDINFGATTTLSWSTANAVTCTSTDFSVNDVRGSTIVSPTTTKTYTLNCKGVSGEAAPASVTVNVSKPTLPDLIVVSIYSEPNQPKDGQNVLFSATVKNQGVAATPLGAVLGVGFLVDGIEVSWSDDNIQSLQPGESVTLRANSGPFGRSGWRATAGTHLLEAWVNDVNRFQETSIENNTFTTSLNVINDKKIKKEKEKEAKHHREKDRD